MATGPLLSLIHISLGECASDICSGTVGIVGKCIYDDGDTVGTITFVSHVLVVHIAYIAGCLLNTAIDSIIWHVVSLSFGDNGSQFKVVSRIGTCLLYTSTEIMNYKKSILSVVLWFVYAIIVGTGMVGTAMAVTLPAYGALIITGVWLAVTGLAVFLLHRFLEKTKPPFSEDRQQIKLIAESLLVVSLIAAGIVLRTGEIMRYDL